MTRQLAHELGPWGITVNNIAPGFVRSNPATERQWESYGEEGQRALVDRIALKRLGTPDDIAYGVLFSRQSLLIGSRVRCCRSMGGSDGILDLETSSPTSARITIASSAELIEFAAIPSVSTDPAHAGDMDVGGDDGSPTRSQSAGPFDVQTIATAGNPVVYAEWLGAPGKPTVLVYGHYDVQPPDPLEKWHQPAIHADRPRRTALRARRVGRQRADADPDQGRRRRSSP